MPPYQAPPLPGGSIEALELIAAQVKECEAVGVEILCCPEAVLGGLADHSRRPAELAIDAASGPLRTILRRIDSSGRQAAGTRPASRRDPDHRSSGTESVEHPNGAQARWLVNARGSRRQQSRRMHVGTGCAIQSCPEKVRAADPARYITPGDPSLMILHGGSDPLVPHNQGERLYMALNRA